MKLLKLEIHNIASITDAVIDFTSSPLADDSQFLITGKTGSGKTTILDAICLALYNQTPRMKNAKSSKIEDADGDNIADNDIRTLMRKNTAEAYSQVTFADKDDNILVARWYCYRARKKVTGALQAIAHTYSDANGTVLANKVTDIKNLIAERIGLTFEQFCRTSMLAQGEFSKFLRAKDDEKSEILEKLTGLGIYSEIGAKIFAISSEKSNHVKNLEEQTKNIIRLSDDEVAEKETSLTALETAIREQTTRKTAFEQAKLWFESILEVNKKINEITKDEERHNALINSDTFRNIQNTVRDWMQTESVRSQYTQMIDAQNSLKNAKHEDNRAMQSFANLSGEFLTLENNKKTTDQRCADIARFISDNETKRPVYDNATLIKEHLKAIKENQDQQIILRKECEELSELMARSQNEIALLNRQLETATNNEHAKQTEISEKQNAANKFDQPELTQRCTILTATNRLLGEIKEKYTLYIDKSANIKNQEQNISNLEAEITAASVAYAQACDNLTQAEAKVETAQIQFNKLKNSADDFLKTIRATIRATLKDGDTCPLCGQKIIELTSDEEFEKIIAPLRLDLDNAKAYEKETRDEANKCQVLLKAKQSTLDTARTDCAKLKSQAETIIRDLDHYEIWSIYATSNNVLDQITDDIAKNDIELDSIANQQKQLNDILTAINKLQAEKAEITKRKTDICDQINKHQQVITQSAAIKEGKGHNIANAQQTVSVNIEKVTAIYGCDDWLKDWEQNNGQFISQLQNDADNYRRIIEEQTTLTNRLATINQDIDNINKLVDDILSMRPQWKKNTEPHSLQPNLANRFSSLYADIKSNTDSMARLLEQENKTTIEIKKFLKSNNHISIEHIGQLISLGNKINEYRNTLDLANNESVRIKTQKYSTIATKNELENNRPQMDENETIESINDKIAESSNRINEALTTQGAIAQQLKQDADNKANFKEKLKEIEYARSESMAWAKLANIFGSSDGKKFRTIAQSFILNDMLINANSYLNKFTSRYEMKGQPGSLAIAVIDHDMADAERPTSNLSGGESFLLSLSLALGLSSLSNQAMAMDTLFIDEGFGTLDGEYLSTVINTLEQLHNMGGKKVGIISHIDSLKERITTQIQVDCVGNSHSEVRVMSIL